MRNGAHVRNMSEGKNTIFLRTSKGEYWGDCVWVSLSVELTATAAAWRVLGWQTDTPSCARLFSDSVFPSLRLQMRLPGHTGTGAMKIHADAGRDREM